MFAEPFKPWPMKETAGLRVYRCKFISFQIVGNTKLSFLKHVIKKIFTPKLYHAKELIRGQAQGICSFFFLGAAVAVVQLYCK